MPKAALDSPPSGASGTGTLTLTSRRLLWCPTPGAGGALCGELARVCSARVVSSSGVFKRKHTLRLSVAAQEAGTAAEELELRLEGGGHDELEARLTTLLQRRAWQSDQAASKSPASDKLGFTASRAGVGGIIRRQEAQQRETTKLAAEVRAPKRGARPVTDDR